MCGDYKLDKIQMNTGTIKTSIKETSKFNWGTVQHLMITPLTVCF